MNELELFSPMEKVVLRIIGKKKLSIIEITEEMYGKAKRPLNASNSIATAVRRINTKCELHRLPWFINGTGAGRQGRTVWKDKK